MDATNKDRVKPEVVSVVILYEDRKTRDRALDVCRHMQGQVGGEIEWKFSWWRFDFLQDSKLAEQAAEASSVGDLLVISAHPGGGLPDAFTRWVETWLPNKTHRESLLVALIGSEQDPQEDLACDYLRTIATRGKMDYLGSSLLMARIPAGNAIQPLRSQSVERKKSGPDPSRIMPPSHWGINE